MGKRRKLKNLKNRKRKSPIDKINHKEQERLGASGVANTYHFRTRQKFGPASEVRHVDPKECDLGSE